MIEIKIPRTAKEELKDILSYIVSKYKVEIYYNDVGRVNKKKLLRKSLILDFIKEKDNNNLKSSCLFKRCQKVFYLKNYKTFVRDLKELEEEGKIRLNIINVGVHGRYNEVSLI